MTRTARLVDSLATALPTRFSRRGFFAGSAVVASAIAVDPVSYVLKPGSAYAAVCNCKGSACQCGSACCDGYTEFCCTLTGNNSCPPGSLMAGWWKADGTQFCGGPRYYMDCNSTCGGCGCGSTGVCSGACSGTPCGCGNGDCNNRAAGCNEFRYGQCHQEIACLGPIICRVVTCVPPWAIEPTCTTTSRVDDATATHNRDCLHAVVGALESAVAVPGGIRVTGWALDFDTQAPVQLHAYLDGKVAASGYTSLTRTDIAARFPGYTTARGFSFVVPSAGGLHTVCIYGINAAYGGANPLLGCLTVQPVGPFGAIDLMSAGKDTVRVAGWAIDPDAPDPVTVQLLVDGVIYGQVVASGARPDVAAAYPGAGPAHGFDMDIPVPTGVHNFCVRALNIGPGQNTNLDCRSLTLGVPYGALEVVEKALPGVRVKGWAVDPDTAGPVDIQISIDGALVKTTTADLLRPDVAASHPGAGAAHGYDLVVAATPGPHQVCVTAINIGSGPNPSLGCSTVTIPTGNPYGVVDTITAGPSTVEVTGWVIDPDTAASTTVRVEIDGVTAGTATATNARPDVAAAYPGYGAARGFRLTVPATGGLRRVSVYGVNLLGGTSDSQLITRSVMVGGAPFGSLDLVHAVPGGIRVAGWTIDPDTAAAATVTVTIDGIVQWRQPADGHRSDLAAAFPLYGGNHAFDFTVPIAGGARTICVLVANAGAGSDVSLGCRGVQVPTGMPFGVMDRINVSAGQVQAVGWAIDPDAPGPVSIELWVDGAKAGTAVASRSRSDIGQIFPDYGPGHGFEVTAPVGAGTHQVCVYAVDLAGGQSDALLQCQSVQVP